MLIETPPPFRNDDLLFDFARQPWQLRQYTDLRRRIFCTEQRIFSTTDRDEIDRNALPIVAVSNCMGMPDRVVGVVRIDEREPGLWFGSRLGVADAYRQKARFTIQGLFDADNAPDLFKTSVGAALIFKAVSTATALGCRRFLANVQMQNVSFFERMQWTTLHTVELHGMTHARMEASLRYYPPSQVSLAQLKQG